MYPLHTPLIVFQHLHCFIQILPHFSQSRVHHLLGKRQQLSRKDQNPFILLLSLQSNKSQKRIKSQNFAPRNTRKYPLRLPQKREIKWHHSLPFPQQTFTTVVFKTDEKTPNSNTLVYLFFFLFLVSLNQFLILTYWRNSLYVDKRVKLTCGRQLRQADLTAIIFQQLQPSSCQNRPQILISLL